MNNLKSYSLDPKKFYTYYQPYKIYNSNLRFLRGL